MARPKKTVKKTLGRKKFTAQIVDPWDYQFLPIDKKDYEYITDQEDRPVAIKYKNWKAAVIGEFSVGASKTEMMAMLGVSDDLFERWCIPEEEPEFSQTIKRGLMLSKAWWYREGRKLRDKDLNHVQWYMNMKNRFGWKDKSEVDNKHNGTVVLGFNFVRNDEDSNTDNKAD